MLKWTLDLVPGVADRRVELLEARGSEMGLDAFVRCRCFEDGKCRPAPVPWEDLFVDEEGYVSSRTLETAYQELGWKDYRKQYGVLSDAMWEWNEHPCEHENGKYCSEWVGTWAGVSGYRALIASVGQEKLPVLSKMLPEANGGCFPVELAEAALRELDILDEESSKTEDVLIEGENGEEAWRISSGHPYAFMFSPRGYQVGLADEGLFVAEGDRIVFLSAHFRQTPTGYVENGDHEMLLESLDEGGNPTGERYKVFGSLLHGKDAEMSFVVRRMQSEGQTWRSDVLRRLLRASLETGNPIQWC